MNPDLYTDEFKSFKLLQLSPEFSAYYRMVGNMINSIQPGPLSNDPSFEWPFRVEFVDQLLDLAGQSVYIVNTSELENSHDFYEYASILEIDNLLLFSGSITVPTLRKSLTHDDVAKIENNQYRNVFWMAAGDTKLMDYQILDSELLSSIIDLSTLPVVPRKNIGYTALFSRRDVAEHYRDSATTALRNKKAAVSAISRYF